MFTDKYMNYIRNYFCIIREKGKKSPNKAILLKISLVAGFIDTELLFPFLLPGNLHFMLSTKRVSNRNLIICGV